MRARHILFHVNYYVFILYTPPPGKLNKMFIQIRSSEMTMHKITLAQARISTRFSELTRIYDMKLPAKGVEFIIKYIAFSSGDPGVESKGFKPPKSANEWQLMNDKSMTVGDLKSIVKIATEYNLYRLAEMCLVEVENYTKIVAELDTLHNKVNHSDELLEYVRKIIIENGPPLVHTKNSVNNKPPKSCRKRYIGLALGALGVAAIGFTVYHLNKK